MSMPQAVEAVEFEEFIPTEENGRQLRNAFGCFATGVTIVTVNSDEGPIAITANSFSSVSMNPPLVLWSVDKDSSRAPFFLGEKNFAIHILDASQEEICWRIAKDKNGLKAGEYTLSDKGVPLLNMALARFECSQYSVTEGGDHRVIIGEVQRVRMDTESTGLGFFRGQVGEFSAVQS